MVSLINSCWVGVRFLVPSLRTSLSPKILPLINQCSFASLQGNDIFPLWITYRRVMRMLLECKGMGDRGIREIFLKKVIQKFGRLKNSLIFAGNPHIMERESDLNLRHCITGVLPNMGRVLVYKGETFESLELAEGKIQEIKDNNSEERVLELLGSDLQPMLVSCDKNNQPKKIYFE